MTLLESIVAFVVLSLVGIACLDLSRGAVQLQRSSAEWTEAVRRGDAALAAASVGDDLRAGADIDVGDAAGQPPGASARTGSFVGPVVTRRPWRTDRRVEVIEVAVPLADGGTYRVQRLVRRRGGRDRVAGGSTMTGIATDAMRLQRMTP